MLSLPLRARAGPRVRRGRGLRRRWWVLAAFLVLSASSAAFFGSYRFDPEIFDPHHGGPLVLLDRSGVVLRRLPSADGRPGREAWVPLSEVSSHAILTLIASEDQRFYDHAGVDPEALLRALWLNVTAEETYGGSTLTMQLARMVHSPGESRTAWVKLLEIRAALGIEGSLDKGEILEQYLNRAYYGRGAWGIEAAAWRYFGKPAASLSVGEATFLAVLPRGPARYDPIRHRDRVLARRHHLFELLVAQGRLGEGEVRRAEAQRLDLELHPLEDEAPHFVEWVLSTLPADLRAGGGTIHTTLDVGLQRALEHRTEEHVRANERWDVSQAGAVVLDTESGAVLAMVGSRGWASDAGQINITTRRRFPGSALKPFVYATAVEGGRGPASVAFDVRDISPRYRDPGPERGPVAYREALASSYNFAAVGVIEQVGVERVMERLRRAGVSDLVLPPDDYGARLALGSTKVRLLDLAAAYRFTVRGGRVVTPVGVIEAEEAGRVRFRPPLRERQVFSAEASWLVMDMLSDPEARRPMFGEELAVDLPYRVVAKTGTAEGFSDTVAVLATDQLIAAAWAGRFDGRSTQGRAGMAAAAPLARAALLLASDGALLTLPPPPDGLARGVVCPLSGLAPGPHCPHRRHDRFVAGTIPAEPCDWHRADGTVRYPDALAGWARRAGRLAGR